MPDDATVDESVGDAQEAGRSRRARLTVLILTVAAIVIVLAVRRRRTARSTADLVEGDQVFRTTTDQSGATTLTFGDGIAGARPPSGTNAVSAGYRSGSGAAKRGATTTARTARKAVKEHGDHRETIDDYDGGGREALSARPPRSGVGPDQLEHSLGVGPVAAQRCGGRAESPGGH